MDTALRLRKFQGHASYLRMAVPPKRVYASIKIGCPLSSSRPSIRAAKTAATNSEGDFSACSGGNPSRLLLLDDHLTINRGARWLLVHREPEVVKKRERLQECSRVEWWHGGIGR